MKKPNQKSGNIKINHIDTVKQEEFYDTIFHDAKLNKAELQHKTFENCQFNHCNFNEATLTACKFVDCDFKSCNLNAVTFKNTSFNDVVFEESKLMGINWTQAKWPYINLASPIKFYTSNISHSSFYGLDLKEIIIEECKVHDVDFRGCNLSNGSFLHSDFETSLFII